MEGEHSYAHIQGKDLSYLYTLVIYHSSNDLALNLEDFKITALRAKELISLMKDTH